MRPSGNVYNMLSACARRLGALACCVALSFLPTGCAIHYFDDKTGTEHLIGFGHMRMRVAPTEKNARAVAAGVNTAGVTLDVGKKNYGLLVGFQRQVRVEVDENASVCFEWPTNDLFDVRVGSTPPFLNQPKEESAQQCAETSEGTPR